MEGEAAVNTSDHADAALEEETEAAGLNPAGGGRDGGWGGGGRVKKKRERKIKRSSLTLLRGLVRDVAPICLIDAKVNKQGEDGGEEGEGEGEGWGRKMHKPFSPAVDLELIL